MIPAPRLELIGVPYFESACHGKMQHPTLENAQLEARRMKRKFKRQYNAYYCGYCQQFHVGHRSKRGAK